ncbi:hypothetical protein niasHS_003492 [Heterodera schachtii]|uniref:DUF4139 domain-containing protein n=1 Tax=Heterodera schachtii TaxID=97005 RepID=A0ABD2KH60_HETSC
MSYSRSISSDAVPLSPHSLISRRGFPSLPTVVLEARDLATKSVVVFKERAEVKRLIALEQVASGKTLIRVNNVSPMVSRESIRVEGQRGALILEVEYEETPQLSGGWDGDELEKQLERETNELELRIAELNDQIEVLQRRLDVLDGVAKQIGKNAIVSTETESPRRCQVTMPNTVPNVVLSQQKGNTAQTNNGTNQQQVAVAPASLFLLCEDSMKNLTSFLDYYGKTAGETRREMREKNKQMGELKERHVRTEWELNKRRGRMEYDKNRRAIGILIEVPEASLDVELHLIYQVFGCSWRPAYSLRASTSGGVLNGSVGEQKEGEGEEEDCSEAVLLSYHGMVEQNTDEDWDNVELILSTALPCSTSAIPALPTVTAMLQRTALSGFRSRNVSSASNRRKPNSRLATVSQEELDAGIGSFDYNELVDAHHLQQQLQQQLQTRGLSAHGSGSEQGSSASADQIPSTHFQVDQHCSIPADGQQHKVDIAHIELTPTLWHECVPSRLCSAFVSAQLVNSSQLPLLPGPLSVFFNNTFTSTTHLNLVLPGEEFRCLLGVDPALKVEYKRAQLSNQQVGFMSRSCLCTHEQVISLRNAKASQSCRVTVREPIPKAADEKIKISLLQPDLKAQRAEARLLAKESQLEWTVKLGPGEQREMSVKWTAEYPAQESVLLSSSSAPSAFVQPLASTQLLAGRTH